MAVADDKERLAMADRHVAEAERILAAHLDLIAWLERHGHNTELAYELLGLMRDYLRVARTHQSLILARLGRRE